MKKPMAVLMMVLLISACAAPVYQPASGGGYGYRESQVADNRYRVSFRMRGDNRFEAMDYALLRASELTLMAGYDWFVVVDRQVDGKQQESGSKVGARRTQNTERRCGLLGCTTDSSPSTAYGAEIRSGDRSESEVILEIRLGKGVRPAEGDSYDALEVRDNLRKRANYRSSRGPEPRYSVQVVLGDIFPESFQLHQSARETGFVTIPQLLGVGGVAIKPGSS